MNSSWVKYLPSHVVTGAATLGPLGFWGKAPGTVGSIAGLVLYTLVFFPLGIVSYVLFLAVLIYLSIAFCGEAEIRMHRRDPGEIILDEFVAIPVCFIGLQHAFIDYPGWIIILAGFGLFRFFDIVKPFGIKKLQALQGGLGVVVDDIVAALVTCLLLHLGVALADLYYL